MTPHRRPRRRAMSPVRRLVIGMMASFCVLSASAAGAELATWDQARATAIGQQLADAADASELAVREQPGGEVGSGDAQEGFGLANKARALREQARALAGHLAAGKGHDDTRNYYRGLKELVDDTEQMAQRAELDEPTMDAWAKVADLQRQIAPFYDPKALEEKGQ
jgi:hypothetical protein